MKTWINQAIAKTQFWWAKKTIKEGVNFMFVDDPTNKFDPFESPVVEILTGKFSGIRIKFEKMIITNFEESLLEFQTVVVYNPDNIDVLNKKFEKLSTNILRIILANTVNCSAKDAIQGLNDNENRTPDTDEPYEKREFYEEVTPLLEKRVSKRNTRKKTVPRNSRLHSKVQPTSKPKRSGTKSPRKNKSE